MEDIICLLTDKFKNIDLNDEVEGEFDLNKDDSLGDIIDKINGLKISENKQEHIIPDNTVILNGSAEPKITVKNVFEILAKIFHERGNNRCSENLADSMPIYVY